MSNNFFFAISIQKVDRFEIELNLARFSARFDPDWPILWDPLQYFTRMWITQAGHDPGRWKNPTQWEPILYPLSNFFLQFPFPLFFYYTKYFYSKPKLIALLLLVIGWGWTVARCCSRPVHCTQENWCRQNQSYEQKKSPNLVFPDLICYCVPSFDFFCDHFELFIPLLHRKYWDNYMLSGLEFKFKTADERSDTHDDVMIFYGIIYSYLRALS